MRLTQAGECLLGFADRLLPQLDRAEDRLRQYALEERGAPPTANRLYQLVRKAGLGHGVIGYQMQAVVVDRYVPPKR